MIILHLFYLTSVGPVGKYFQHNVPGEWFGDGDCLLLITLFTTTN